MSTATTLPGLLLEQAARRPRAAAIRQKRLGIWRQVTWEEYAEEVRAVAVALDDLGVAAGDRVAVFADNEPRWLYVDLAVQALGAASAGVYPALDVAAATDAIRRTGARVVVCGDQEQVDKLMEGSDDLSSIERLVVLDLTGLHTPEYAGLPIQPYDELVAHGRSLRASSPGRFDELLAARRPDEVAIVAFTPGTTGPVRGVLLSHAGQVALARIAAASIALGERDEAYSLLPLAHATARLFDAYAPLVAGSTIAFAESLETVPTDIVEAAPTVLVATPRLLEQVRGAVQLRTDRAGRFKRASFRWAMRRREAAVARGSSSGARLADLLVTRFVRRHAGLARVRFAGIGGSFVATDLLRWFWAVGVPVREQYGQVETGGIVTAQRGEGDLGTAGAPVDPAIELRLDGEELFVRGPGIAVGTLDGESLVDADGWYRTGDLARVDADGRVIPIGRRAHVLVTASGHEISPAEIESALKASPYVASAMVVARGRPYVAAVIELDQLTVADWARRAGVPVSTYAALATNEQVVRLIESEVRTASDALPTEQRVLAFRVLQQPLGDELTPTGKIRRGVVESRFAALIDEMYAEHALTRLGAEA